MKKIYYIIPLMLVLFTNCQDVIDLNVAEGEKRIIINGRITDTLAAEVSIYVTADYLSTSPNPRISNAVVKVYENNVLMGQLSESGTEPGYYRGPYFGTEGNNYHIEVFIPEGSTYFSNTTWVSGAETMNRIYPIDSTYSVFKPKAPFQDEGYYAYTMFTEPIGKGDNYRERIWRDDSLYATQYDLTVYDDEFIDGRSFNNKDLSAAQVGGEGELGEVYKVEYSSISYEGRKFLSLLIEQTTQVGSPFDPAPAPIYGNISNANDPNQLGLGYFFASKLTYATIELKD